jgi:hypothetical protein
MCFSALRRRKLDAERDSGRIPNGALETAELRLAQCGIRGGRTRWLSPLMAGGARHIYIDNSP